MFFSSPTGGNAEYGKSPTLKDINSFIIYAVSGIICPPSLSAAEHIPIPLLGIQVIPKSIIKWSLWKKKRKATGTCEHNTLEVISWFCGHLSLMRSMFSFFLLMQDLQELEGKKSGD